MRMRCTEPGLFLLVDETRSRSRLDQWLITAEARPYNSQSAISFSYLPKKAVSPRQSSRSGGVTLGSLNHHRQNLGHPGLFLGI